MGHLACSWRTIGVYEDLGEQNRHPEFEFMEVEKFSFHNSSFTNSSFVFSFFSFFSIQTLIEIRRN